jgi:hypothetical protein
VVALTVYALVIAPVLRSGFIQDDRFDVLWGQLRHQYSLGALTDGVRWTDIYVHFLGRFHPLAHLVGSFSFELSEREAYKILQFVLTLTVAAVFLYLLNSWTADRRTGPVAVLVLAAVGQFRTDFDPILSFGIHTKVLLLILLLQLVLIDRIAKGSRRLGTLKAGLVMLLLSAAMYHEIAAVSSIGLVFVTGHLEHRDASFVRRLVLWVFLAYVTLRVRMYMTTSTVIAMPYYQLSTSPLAVLVAFIKQISGLLPYVSTSSWDISILPSPPTFLLFFLLVGTTTALVGVSRSPAALDALTAITHRQKAICLTLVWWIVGPAAVVALSSGHQLWSSWGGGYINIWVAQIGLSGVLGIAITVGLDWARTPRSSYCTIVTAVLVVFSSFTARVNSVIVDSNPSWQVNTQINGWEREQALRSINAGVLKTLKQSETLVASPPRPWMNESYLRVLTGDSHLKLSNSWARFAEMPVSWPTGCVLQSYQSIFTVSSMSEKVAVCPDPGAKVMASFADDYENGYSLLATLLRLSIALDPQTEQNRLNMTHTLVRELIFTGSGRYAKCSSLVAISSTGEAVRLPISGLTLKAADEALSAVSVRLNSILPTDCS